MRRPEALRTLLASVTLALAACGGGSSDEANNAPPPPPPPPKQEVVVESVADVMKRLGIDRRVKMDETERPNSGDANTDLKRLEAVLTFFDAMVKGDAARVKPMLSKADQATLELMMSDGQWEKATGSIDRVTVGCCSGAEPETCMALAIYTSGDRFDPQLWTVRTAEATSFEAMPQPPGIMEQLKGSKAEPRVQQWTKILKDQVDRSKQPDEKVELAQQDRSIGGEGGSEGESSPGAPSAPEGPKGPGKRKPGGPSVPTPKGPGAPGGPG